MTAPTDEAFAAFRAPSAVRQAIPDIYVTHDWRITPAYERALAMLDEAFGMSWRCYSTPWYDPSIATHTPAGEALLLRQMEEQIAGAAVVVALPADSPRGEKWISAAIEIAGRLGKPLIGIVNDTAAVDVDGGLVGWDSAALARKIGEAGR